MEWGQSQCCRLVSNPEIRCELTSEHFGDLVDEVAYALQYMTPFKASYSNEEAPIKAAPV